MQTIEVNAREAALVVIDLQQGIVGLQTAPYAAHDVVQRSAELAASFREAGGVVVYVRVDLQNLIEGNVDISMRDPNTPAAASELVPEAGRQPSDLLITKRHWSAFQGTELEKELRSRGVRTIVLVGIATNFGAESTARDAAGLGFDLVFVEDAMTTFSSEWQDFAANFILPRLGRVRKSKEVKVLGGNAIA